MLPIANCAAKKNLIHIAKNNGLFITIVPKDRKEVKQFLKGLKKKDVKRQDAFKVANSRKKDKINVYRTHESERTRLTKDGFRIIFVHSSSKQEE